MSTLSPASAAAFDPQPVTLEGRRVRLEPLELARHGEGLLAIGLDPDLWRWTLNYCDTPEKLRAYLDTALREQGEGRSIVFATMDVASGRVAGWTWVGRPWQRSYVNTAAKYLMLRHAFEGWGCMRVEFKTNVLNQRSRDAMKRIG